MTTSRPVRIGPAKAWREDTNGRRGYEALWKIGDRRVRIGIRVDSYDMQSHARAEIFDPGANAWNVVATIPYPQMASKGKAYGQVMPTAEFERDEAALLAEVGSLF
jgi:hypothetical protein